MMMGKYGVFGDLLGMGARTAVRSYTHYPQVARVCYKPPPTAPVSGAGDETGTSAAPSSSRSTPGGGRSDGAGVAEASSATMKQQAAAATVALDGTDFILYARV